MGVDVIPGATGDLAGGRGPEDATLPIASYLWTISVIEGRRGPPTRELSWGTAKPDGVIGVSDFPSEVDFDVGNTSKDCGRPRETAVGVPGIRFAADTCFTWELGERRLGDLLGDRGTSSVPERAACRCCGELAVSFAAEGTAMDRLLGGFVTVSGASGFGSASLRRSLVWTTPPPHRSTKSCTELCLLLCLRPDAFSTDFDALKPTTSSGLSSSLDDIFPSRGDSNGGCILQSSEEEDRWNVERFAYPVSES